MVLAALGQTGTGLAAAAAGGSLEVLHYRVDLGPWENVARVHLRLTQVGPERYRAEFGGAAQGAWSLLSRWLPERYETEMALVQGRLKPLIYREEFQFKGRRIRKEYRFDYSRGVMEVWRGADHQEPVKETEFLLQEALYDPLSLFYNLRLGAFGPLTGGETLRVAMVPTPKPQELIIHLGPETTLGRKVMVEVKAKGSGDDNRNYFIFSTPQGVPQRAWTRVLTFGRLSGELLNPGETMKEGLPELPRLSLNPSPTNRKN